MNTVGKYRSLRYHANIQQRVTMETCMTTSLRNHGYQAEVPTLIWRRWGWGFGSSGFRAWSPADGAAGGSTCYVTLSIDGPSVRARIVTMDARDTVSE